jgi:hypothetical protein
MSLQLPELTEALDALREHHVSALLETMAGLIEAGADVEAEPWLRGSDDLPRRSAVLRLPARGDLAATRGGLSLPLPAFVPEPPEALPVSFPDSTLVLDDGFELTVSPFPWQGAELAIRSGPRPPDWSPLRRWALEWMQGRLGPESPELAGAIHALGDPRQHGSEFRLAVDFGSAPLEAFGALCAALPSLGAAEAALGPRRPD